MSCYRESNGVYFTRGDHHPDCTDPLCRGCLCGPATNPHRHRGERMSTETITADETGRHHRNGHLLELRSCYWRCLHCDHRFDAAVDAELFWCGDDCTGKHHEDQPA